MKARLSLSGHPKRQFDAVLPTANISVGGCFFESTYFLKLGTAVDVELELPPERRVVKAHGKVVRHEQPNAKGRGRSGFAVQFTSYAGDSQLRLASYFLAPVAREFLDRYARAQQMRMTAESVALLSDVLAAWELEKSSLTHSPLFAGTQAEPKKANPR